MGQLLEKIVDFPKWWVIEAPLSLFTISRRFIAQINNQLAFTLNLRLIFTPLFGDYTLVGRCIGFVIRFFEVIFGLIVIGVLYIIALLIPLLWWFLPFIILSQTGTKSGRFLLLPLIILTFFLRKFLKRNVPSKRVTEVSLEKNNQVLESFRPVTLRHLRELQVSQTTGVAMLLRHPHIQLVLDKAELTDDQFAKELLDSPKVNPSQIAEKAYQFAKEHKTRYVEVEHLFLSVLSLIPKIEVFLAKYNSKVEIVENTVQWVVSQREGLAKVFIWQEDYEMPKLRGAGRGMTGRVTPNLDSVSEDFTKMVQKGVIKSTVWRDKEIGEMAALLGSSRVNVLIVGPPGCGKTSIVKGIAHHVTYGTEHKSLKFKRIVSLAPGALIAGAKTSGGVADKFKKVMDEVGGSGDIILFIDEIQNLLTADTGSTDASVSNAFSILGPYLSAGRIQFIGAVTTQNYRKYIEPNGAFARLFKKYELPQASKQDTLRILKEVAVGIEKKYQVTVTYPALEKTVELSEKLIHERVLPDKAIDVLDRTAATSTKSDKRLTSHNVAQEISQMTHVPVTQVTADESQKLLNIETDMRKMVIGQNEAINQIGAALKRARAGMRDEKKPISSFLFVGTTGVGKTETAKTLARIYFGSEDTMIRLDMSEYQHENSIQKLIGTSDGKTKGILTEAVRTKPFALILLDEIEKSHSSVLLTFLQVLDDGRLTDSTGRVIDFTNTIIIATSNVGTRVIQEVEQRNGNFEEMQTATMKEVRNHFAPEFLNRFNGIIVFRPLTEGNVTKITDLMLDRVRKRADQKGVKVGFKPELIQELAKRGYTPEWGARPLARTIENTVGSHLAVKLLDGSIKMGDEVVLGMEIFEKNEEPPEE